MNKWHRINFNIQWNKQSSPIFFVDIIILDLIVRPIISKFGSRIDFWSFHRSADGSTTDGHVLKFNFYTNSKITNSIMNEIISNTQLEFVKTNYLLNDTEINLEPVNKNDENINSSTEAISDIDQWPREIQKSWPYYIRGVCEMFLKLIGEVKKNYASNFDQSSKEQLEQYYKTIEKEITNEWLKYGWHAFLHHIGAIFGYSPVLPQVRYQDKTTGGIIL